MDDLTPDEPQEETYFFALTAEGAEEYFQRCIEREAVTPAERIAILAELNREKKIMAHGKLDDPVIEGALKKFFRKTKHKGVLGFRKDPPPEIENEGC